MTHPYTPEQALARDLLTLAVNGGIAHWARVHGYTADGPPERVRAHGVTIAGRSLWTIDLADMAHAVTKLIDQPEACTGLVSGKDSRLLHAAATILRATLIARRNHLPLPGDARLDQRIADLVIQIAVADTVSH